MFRIFTLLAACLFTAVGALAQQPLLIGRVSLNQSHIAFTYAGKIWLVERTGGTAKRLTNTPNEETSPVFSPDGRRIAFSQSNGNDWDVFIAPADGSGEPTRVTMMPEDDFVTAWSPDGKEVIFETTRDEETLTHLYKTSADRLALATALPLHQSYSGSISPDGGRIVYNPRSGAGDWRYYRETGAFMFKLAKVGPIVGKRTFGGGIGPYYFTPNLIDGGRVQLPNRAAYDPSGTTWGIENLGVAPDFDVEITPADVIAGRDPQLETAIEVALAQLSKNPLFVPKRPPFPVHPGEQSKALSVGPLPPAGSAFPAPAPKIAASAVTDGKYAAFIGSYDSGTMGTLVVRQEGDKLFALDPGGQRIELVPEATADKFLAQPVGASVSFERDAAKKVVAIIVTLSDGRVIRGRKT